MFQKYFKNKTIYSTLGNHEGLPVNLFPLSNEDKELNNNWLYKELIDEWKNLAYSKNITEIVEKYKNLTR